MDRNVLLFRELTCDPDNIFAGKKQTDYFDTRRSEESKQFLPFGYPLRLGTVIGFCQFAKNEFILVLGQPPVARVFADGRFSSFTSSLSKKYLIYMSSSSGICTRAG